MADDKAGDDRTGLPERVTFAASVLVVLSVLVLLLWYAYTGPDESRKSAVPMAEARIEWDGVVPRGERWLIPVTVENVGETPLEEVAVIVEETLPSGGKQETDVTVVFLAEKAEETVYVVAEARPSRERFRARVATLRTRHDTRGY